MVGHFNSKTQQEELLAFIKYKSSIEKFLPLRKSIIDKLHEALGVEITHVIPVSAIPKTTSGKVQRFQLRKNFENGEYDDLLREIEECIQKKQNKEKSIQQPRNELEMFLRESWSKILNIPEQSISIDDAFFALGGNSIKAYQLLDEISKHLKREVGSELLASCKTIRQISEYIEGMPSVDKNSAIELETDNRIDMDKAVAITGLALRLPGAKNQQEFWNNLCSKKDCISQISPKRKELSGKPEWNDWLGELEDIECFDNEFFEISAEEAKFMDPQQRLILETSYEALEDAGMIPGLEEERNIGVYSGISTNTYYQLLARYIEKYGAEKLHPNTMVGNMHNITAAIISHAYNFTGPALSIDTACSSFLAALHHAVEAIRHKSIEGAVVTSANILVVPIAHILSKTAGIVSSTKNARVFDKDADGTVLGEGVVVVYLEPLAKAIKENKNIYAVIRGSAINNDGYSLGIMAPNPKGQYKVLLEAYNDAKLSPGEIGYIEAHGTGTTIGDPIEVNALSKLFSEYNVEKSSNIGIGSVKTNIGHLLSASGGASLAKVLLCLKNKKLVPSLHMEEINPALQIEKTPFYVVQEVEEWKVKEGSTRKAGINSFGLGGTNVHLILEEWNQSHNIQKEKRKVNLLTLSAKSERALEVMIKQTEDMLRDLPELNIHDMCFTRNRYRKHYSYRAACVISENEKARTLEGIKRGQFLKGRSAKTCIYIGDLKKNCKDIPNLFDETSETFIKNFSEISECAKKHGITDLNHYNRNDLAHFTYWYSLVRALKDSGTNINEIYGVNSGQALADAANGKIDLQTALRMYFQEAEGILEENGADSKPQRIKSDIVLSICMQEELSDILPEEVQSKLKIVDFQPSPEGSFDSSLLTIIGELYVAGADFNWDYIYPDGLGKLMNLLSYPFEKKSFWISC